MRALLSCCGTRWVGVRAVAVLLYLVHVLARGRGGGGEAGSQAGGMVAIFPCSADFRPVCVCVGGANRCIVQVDRPYLATVAAAVFI